MTELNVKEVLTQAADFIETQGWFQGGYEDWKNPGCYCVDGALRKAAFGDPDETACESNVRLMPVEAALADVINPGWRESRDDYPFFHVVCWNDAPERTREEVVAALREAAK
jgi:hypothetical protein